MKEIKKPPRAILPANWSEIKPPDPLQRAYRRFGTLAVIVTDEIHDGLLWRHASCSHPDHLPSWEDLREVKDLFVGRNMKAIQVFPRQAEYVNIHPFVLHLWGLPEFGFSLPDFRIGGMI
jgi:hypothetical protein